MSSLQSHPDRSMTLELNSLLRLSSSFSVMAIVLLASGGAIAQSIPPLPQPLTIAQAMPAATTLLFVNPTVGNDASGNGSQSLPFRTITQALRVAPPNTAIVLAAGTYSAETGETFPIALRPGVMIQGDPGSKGEGIVIRGGGTFASPTFANQNITILGANQSGLTGVTVTNPNARGYGLWIESSSPAVASNTFSGSNHDGISVTGNGSPLIQGNHFVQNGANGITIYGTSQAELRENVFERTGFGINIAQNAAPRLIGNRIIQNQDGVVIQANARPVLRGNTIEANVRDGVVAIAQAQPDLGTPAEPGNNVFRSNGRQDINATATRQTISAVGNQLVGTTTGQLNLSGSANVAIAPSPAVTPPSPVATAVPSPVATPATLPPQSTANRPAPSTGSGFGALPQLQPAPDLVAPTQPAAQPIAPTSPSVSPPAASRLNLAVRPDSPTVPPTSEAIEIPVQPPSPTSGVRPTPLPAAADTSIAIPVQPPVAAAPTNPLREVTAVRPTQLPSTAPVVTRGTAIDSGTPIEIPVPLPESRRSVLPPTPSRNVPAAPRAANPTTPANLLPVPTADIPLGNIGDMPTVVVPLDPLQRTAALPSASNRAAAIGLRYRVLVEAESESEQEQVRSLIPGAFRTYANGRVMMQVGAYGDRSNADETVQMLSSNGFRASVQSVE